MSFDVLESSCQWQIQSLHCRPLLHHSPYQPVANAWHLAQFWAWQIEGWRWMFTLDGLPPSLKEGFPEDTRTCQENLNDDSWWRLRLFWILIFERQGEEQTIDINERRRKNLKARVCVRTWNFGFFVLISLVPLWSNASPYSWIFAKKTQSTGPNSILIEDIEKEIKNFTQFKCWLWRRISCRQGLPQTLHPSYFCKQPPRRYRRDAWLYDYEVYPTTIYYTLSNWIIFPSDTFIPFEVLSSLTPTYFSQTTEHWSRPTVLSWFVMSGSMGLSGVRGLAWN